MYREAHLDKSQGGLGHCPPASRIPAQGHSQSTTHVLAVSSQTAYLQAQPKLNPPATAIHYYGSAVNGVQSIVTDVHVLPQLVKGTQPLTAFSSRDSQHSRFSWAFSPSSGGATSPTAAAASAPSTERQAGGVRSGTDSAEATPKSQRGCFSITRSSVSAMSSALRPLGCFPATSSRRTSHASSSNSAAFFSSVLPAAPPSARQRMILPNGGRTPPAKASPRTQTTVRLMPTLTSISDNSMGGTPAKTLATPVIAISSLTAVANLRGEFSPNPHSGLGAAQTMTGGATSSVTVVPSTVFTRTDTVAAAERICRSADGDNDGAACASTVATGLADSTVDGCSADFFDVAERITSTGGSYLTEQSGTNGSSPAPTSVLWNLTPYEEEEIEEYLPEVYCTGSIAAAKKIQGKWTAKETANGGYDDENCHYRVVVGDHIGYRYEVTKELGRGTFGVVVSAIDHKPANGKGGSSGYAQVAIKLIKNKPAYTKQAKEEARLLDMLVSGDPKDEANIVRQLATFTFRNHYAIVFELLQSDLYSYMQANNYCPFTQRFIFSFAEHTLKALDYLSRHGIVHCDVKPENIVVDGAPPGSGTKPLTEPDLSAHNYWEGSRGNPTDEAIAHQDDVESDRTNDPSCRRFKLIDFGSSCTIDKRVFTYIQSRYYRAPEIVLGIPYTPSIDMWSFGCVLCELANGLPIFPASGEGELLERITEYLGHVPAYLIAKGKRVDKFFAPPSPTETAPLLGADGHNSAPERKILPGLSKRGRPRKAAHSRSIYAFLGSVRERYGRKEAHLFTDFIAACLCYDPEHRLSPRDALNHPWMQKWRAIVAENWEPYVEA